MAAIIHLDIFFSCCKTQKHLDTDQKGSIFLHTSPHGLPHHLSLQHGHSGPSPHDKPTGLAGHPLSSLSLLGLKFHHRSKNICVPSLAICIREIKNKVAVFCCFDDYPSWCLLPKGASSKNRDMHWINGNKEVWIFRFWLVRNWIPWRIWLTIKFSIWDRCKKRPLLDF
jgi:hypothetical protein